MWGVCQTRVSSTRNATFASGNTLGRVLWGHKSPCGNGDTHSLGFPHKTVFFQKRKPSFSDTYQRSRRDTAAEMIVRTPRIFFVSKKLSKNTIWTLFSRVRFLVRCSPNKEGPGAQGPGPIWAKAHMGQGPYGPQPKWARAHTLAHMGSGPYGRSLAYQIFSIPDF